jgi:hypothetical protein
VSPRCLLAPAQGRGRGSRKRPRGTLHAGARRKWLMTDLPFTPEPMDMVRKEAAPATKVTLHLALPFIPTFPSPKRGRSHPGRLCRAGLASGRREADSYGCHKRAAVVSGPGGRWGIRSPSFVLDCLRFMDACHKKEREITGPNLVEAMVEGHEVTALQLPHRQHVQSGGSPGSVNPNNISSRSQAYIPASTFTDR